MKSKYVNITLASKILGYSTKTISRLIEDAILPTYRVNNGGQIRIWIYDLHSVIIYQKPFLTLNDFQKDEVRIRVNEF